MRAAGSERVVVHSLGWLALGNAVGLLLATLLLVPAAGRWAAPLTYGRWVPLHLDFQLYGWCALPIVGLLLRTYLPRRGGDRLAGSAVAAWSGSLLFAALGWLAGHGEARPFVEWSGAGRVLFTAALVWLVIVLAVGLARRLRSGEEPWAVTKALLLAVLAAVPAAFWAGTRPGVYPPVNPASGGPTAGGLIGSTLVLIGILLVVPLLLGLPRVAGAGGIATVVAVWAAHWSVYLVVAAGEASHKDPLQVAGLATLAIWAPLLARHARRFVWPAGAQRWLVAAGAWGALLVASAIPTFLPGALEATKFTSVLVAHAHVAMAGLLTCVLAAILVGLVGEASGLASRPWFGVWQAGCVAHVVAMTAVGLLEIADPGILFRPSSTVGLLYILRWLAGLAMLVTSVAWLRAAIGATCCEAVGALQRRPIATPPGTAGREGEWAAG